MFGIVYAPGLFGLSALFGRDPLQAATHSMALNLCRPHKSRLVARRLHVVSVPQQTVPVPTL
jgi:hypothetical protein